MKFNISLKIKVLLASTWLLGTGSVCAENLSQLYQEATKNDHEYRAAKAAYKAGLETKKEARSNLLPTLGAEARWTDTSGKTQNGTDFDSVTKRYGVTLRQPLFNLSLWNSYRASTKAVDGVQAQFHIAEQELILRTAEAYFSTLRAADTLQTTLSEEEALEQQLEQTRQRFEVGLSAITEVHEAQAVYDSSVADRLIAEGQLSISFEALEVISGKSYQNLSPLKADFAVSPPQPSGREVWVKRAIESNLPLRAAYANAESSRLLSKARRADHYPTLALSGSANHTEQDFENPFSTEDTRSFGVTLNVPIYRGGGTSASRRKQAQLAIQARENYLKAKRDITQQTRSLYVSVETSVATVKARQQAIVSNESALEATQAGYSVGTRDLVDVLNAQRGVFRAKRDYFTALYDYILNSLRLKQVAGNLNEEDLNQLNVSLDAARSVSKFVSRKK